MKTVLAAEIVEIPVKPFTRVDKSCGGGKARARANDDSVRLFDPFFEFLNLLFHDDHSLPLFPAAFIP